MPLNTRNFVQLTTLAPGVEPPHGTLLPRINGGRPRTNEYIYDGTSTLQPEPGQVVFFPILELFQYGCICPDAATHAWSRLEESGRRTGLPRLGLRPGQEHDTCSRDGR